LQNAQNIKEAYSIASKFETFVSESILIGSAQDNEAAIIEKSPTKMGMFFSKTDAVVCANHFQSKTFAKDPNNIKNIETSASPYRELRCWQLIQKKDTFNYFDVASILRDTRGLDGKNIGLGNEKAMNQLISHHSIIFKPNELKVWVSTPPYQLGKYIEYDLHKIFNIMPLKNTNSEICDTNFTIPEDSLLYSKDFENYKKFVHLRHKINNLIKENKTLQNEDSIINEFVSLNPEYYLGYFTAGNYYFTFKKYNKAKTMYNKALTKVFENTEQKDFVKNRLKTINEKIKQ